ncbi:transglutaminase domain protein [Segniliparus rotundus DSM 44985]|uniref:Transglutaminase domain protein n=1 Tax=Segniliparus rotundus (strain ATCC BAA-972 / CDC 1076 / CIP 108378 / DSM 44985 / JCM 13578) TaxID=640132 RepID=D6ZDN4_SEGRD|nr:transglutaminase family protein [Segniliparus rotundus]ADG99291.1 transglutaminase domain protein [Segniliparus rotundus DSM 44985]
MVTRIVSARLDVDVVDSTVLECQIAVAPHPGAQVEESLSFTLNGKNIQAKQILTEHGNRIHTFPAAPGKLLVSYDATIKGNTAPAAVLESDASVFLRPSRYAESDKFCGFAAAEFGDSLDSEALLARVAAWVGARLRYVPGSSDAIDGAADTLLAGRGVCRDYAHLVVAMLRALNVPARLVAVYAPGCDPMDFHAVAEALVNGVWRVVDATCLAPRSTLVRVATGRDAADTAFLDNHRGAIVLNESVVTAVVEGELPGDDLTQLVSIT